MSVEVTARLSTPDSDVYVEYVATVQRTEDCEWFTGSLDAEHGLGGAFRYKTASRATATRMRDEALRRAAAWQAILDTLIQ